MMAIQGWCPPTVLVGLFFFFAIFAFADGQNVRLKNRTDWFSINNESFHRTTITPGNESIDSRTFEILGVALGTDQFRLLAIKLGNAPIIKRGDASAAREQVCYTGGEVSSNVYLVFEFGEDENVFYLFRDGADWNGRAQCVRTKQISMSSGTDSDLKLGLTPTDVEAVLGKADAVFGDRLVYHREIQEKTTPAQFEKLREDYPEQLSDGVAHKKFEFYSVDIYIEARFGKSGLTYLAVSKSGGVD
jgi:hypothetical protein